MNKGIIVKIDNILQVEYFVVLMIVALSTWIFYKTSLRNLSENRHKIFCRLFKNLATWLVLFIILFALQNLLNSYIQIIPTIYIISIYTGLITVLLGSVALRTMFKILVYEYFFFTSMKAGVPRLLVNIFSLIQSLFIFGWLLSYLFDFELAPLFTTSAVISIVLGFALQDTLGNLFAAISLQIDKPFQLDDWIELRNGSEIINGQVKELSWRATTLLAITDEFITIPNRSLAQWQIVNYAAKTRPFYKGYLFRIPHGSSIENVKSVLLSAVQAIPQIKSTPAPLIVVTEMAESWITLKVVYAISEYGQHAIIADKFFTVAARKLEEAKIKLANNRIIVDSSFINPS